MSNEKRVLPVGHVRHALHAHGHPHGHAARGAVLGAGDAGVADEMTIAATLDRGTSDGLQAHRALQRGLELVDHPPVGGQQAVVHRLVVGSFCLGC